MRESTAYSGAMRRFWTGRAAIALILTLALTGSTLTVRAAAPAAHPTAASSGTLTIVVDGTASDIDPASDETSNSDLIARNVEEPLVTLQGASLTRYTPMLATRWTTNATKSVYTFYLRHGVRFHTGRCCLTAQDVKYSIARTVEAHLAASYVFSRFLSHPSTQIKILNPYTVQFVLGRPQPLFLGAISSIYTGMILDAKAVQAHATKTDPWGHLWAQDHDAGTGPYMITSWAHSQQVVLRRFPRYWGGWSGKHFSTVVVRTVPEITTRRELVERGAADLTIDLTPQDYDALKKNPKVRVVAPYGAQIEYIVMTEAGPLASPYARQALSYAFDYNALISGVYHGYARRAYGPLPSVLLGYDPHMFHYQTNLAKAKALLQKAGVKPGTTLTYAYNDPFGPDGLILQAQLAQIGLTLKLEHLDEAAFSNIFYGNEPASKRPNLMPWAWYPDYNDPYDQSDPLIDSQAAGAAGANAGFYHNARVDALLAAMKTANERTQLVGLARQLQDITSRLDPPAIWTDERAKVTVMATSIRGYVFNSLQLDTYDFYSLYRG